jgi:hypothetical protein
MVQTLKPNERASESHSSSDSREGDSQRVQRPALFIGAGGSGVLTVTYLKALFLSRIRVIPAGAGFLGFDVMDSPPTVMIPPIDAGGRGSQVRLKTGIEYCPIGQECDPARLSSAFHSGSDHNHAIQRLIERQPGGRLMKSIQAGTQGERLYGLLGLTWNLADVRRLLSSTLRRLNDLRLPRDGDHGAAIALQVVVVGSVAGGVGSAVVLPLCGEVKRAMHVLGMDVNRSTFVGICYTPDAFPETQLRLSNAFDTLNDFAIAQKEGVTP